MFRNLFNSEKYKKELTKERINELKEQITTLEKEIAEIDKHAAKTMVDGRECFVYELLDGEPGWDTFTPYGDGQFTKPTYLRQQVRNLNQELERLLAEEKSKNPPLQASDTEISELANFLTQLNQAPADEISELANFLTQLKLAQTPSAQETKQTTALEKKPSLLDNEQHAQSLQLFSKDDNTKTSATKEQAKDEEEIIVFKPKKSLRL